MQLASLCDAFCHVLGNTCRIARTAKSYEWNVDGPGAIEAARCFAGQASELETAIDPLAHHVLGLGGRAILDYSDAVVEANPPTIDLIPRLGDMVRILSDGHEQARHAIGAAMDIAQAVDEVPSVHILALRMDAHRQHRRQLLLLGHSHQPMPARI